MSLLVLGAVGGAVALVTAGAAYLKGRAEEEDEEEEARRDRKKEKRKAKRERKRERKKEKRQARRERAKEQRQRAERRAVEQRAERREKRKQAAKLAQLKLWRGYKRAKAILLFQLGQDEVVARVVGVHDDGIVIQDGNQSRKELNYKGLAWRELMHEEALQNRDLWIIQAAAQPPAADAAAGAVNLDDEEAAEG